MLMNKDHFTSLELVDLINQYRKQEGDRKELQHYDFLKIVKCSLYRKKELTVK